MKTFIRLFLLPLLMLSVPAYAEIEKFGNVDVNYNVITTDTLSPAMAKAYGIKRSNLRGMLTIALTQPSDGGQLKHVGANVSATVINMVEQLHDIKIRSITEGGATYYIGDFAIAPPDRLRFVINITETDAKKAYKVEFQKDFQAY
ncbi:MAG: DUF4426 domain-containing protein [Sulfuricella sp.]|nr:DUF4426 domain-containing protein [Sulfuricella sp.]